MISWLLTQGNDLLMKALNAEGGFGTQLVQCIDQVGGECTRSRIERHTLPSIRGDDLLCTIAPHLRGFWIGAAIEQEQDVT
jgi:hypothetical protein